MSVFKNLFAKKETTPTSQEAIQKIREVEDLLNKKSEYLEKKIADELDAARKHGTKNKRLAIQALKRKKRYEAQQSQIDGTLITLEYQREVLENASTNAEVLKVMADASKAFKKANSGFDVDKVHDMMDDISEQRQLADEINSAISNPVGFEQDVDEDELLQELQELQDEEIDREILDIPNAPSDRLPQTSQKVKPAKRDEEEDELSKMAAWANS